jgi:FHS family L-fucose permease-like MFS transporter
MNVLDCVELRKSFAVGGARTLGAILRGKPLPMSLFLLVAAFLFFSSLPEQKDDTPIARGWGALRKPQVLLAALGIFFYVGVEVTVDNNLGALLKTPGYLTQEGLAEHQISKYISLYWGSLMIGRWAGAVAVFNLTGMKRTLATVVVPFLAFALVLGVNRFYGNDVTDLIPYAGCVAVLVASFMFGQERPIKTLLTVSTLATIAASIGVATTGIVSIYALMATGLFCSVMWPCIFALGVTGVGPLKGQASSALVMMILGGAVIPPIQGAVGDALGDMRLSYVVAVACFAILIGLTLLIRRSLKTQNIDLDQAIEAH